MKRLFSRGQGAVWFVYGKMMGARGWCSFCEACRWTQPKQSDRSDLAISFKAKNELQVPRLRVGLREGRLADHDRNHGTVRSIRAPLLFLAPVDPALIGGMRHGGIGERYSPFCPQCAHSTKSEPSGVRGLIFGR